MFTAARSEVLSRLWPVQISRSADPTTAPLEWSPFSPLLAAPAVFQLSLVQEPPGAMVCGFLVTQRPPHHLQASNREEWTKSGSPEVEQC